MDCGGPQDCLAYGEAICESFMQQTQPLRCQARNIPVSTKFADLFMQQGPGGKNGPKF